MCILNNFAIPCIALFRFLSVSYKSDWNAAKKFAHYYGEYFVLHIF